MTETPVTPTEPVHVAAVYTNPIHCVEYSTASGDTIQAGHYYKRFDGVWTCTNCGQVRP